MMRSGVVLRRVALPLFQTVARQKLPCSHGDYHHHHISLHLLHVNGHHGHQHNQHDHRDEDQLEVEYEQLHATLPLLGLQAADGATREEVAFCNQHIL